MHCCCLCLYLVNWFTVKKSQTWYEMKSLRKEEAVKPVFFKDLIGRKSAQKSNWWWGTNWHGEATALLVLVTLPLHNRTQSQMKIILSTSHSGWYCGFLEMLVHLQCKVSEIAGDLDCFLVFIDEFRFKLTVINIIWKKSVYLWYRECEL